MKMPTAPSAFTREEEYSTLTGLIYLFNLIVGTGALALPGCFQQAGWLLGTILLLIIALMSFITVTFLIECLSVANAVSRKRYDEAVERTPLVTPSSNIYEITEKYELGQISVLMTPKLCQVFTFGSLCIYLFGDLAIYILVVAKTIEFVICTDKNEYSETAQCWASYEIIRLNVYRLSIVGFILLLGPFVFFNLQKTKALQIFTATLRWLSFFIMLVWSIYVLSSKGNQGHPGIMESSALPTVFGALVYSFMCQHSIPGLLVPIKHKKYLKLLVEIDYILVATFYLLLILIAVFAFAHIKDIYTLNFWAEVYGKSHSTFLLVLAYFLALFPVFTLSTSFPIIAITLRNNLRALCLKNSPFKWYYDKLLFPLITIIPPTILPLVVSDLHLLIGIVGSYAGAAVQYVIPCVLVLYARREAIAIGESNMYASPFKHKFWIILVFIWMIFSLAIITLNYVWKFAKHK